MTDDEFRNWLSDHWVDILKHCRRAVPDADTLLLRFNRVIEHFQDIVDPTTDEPFFRSKALKAVANLTSHIKNGCLSDVPGISLYQYAGKTKDGLPRYRCCRGTNANEGYHRHLQNVLHHYSGSPELLHLSLLEFNFRWNVRAAVSNCGLHSTIGGFYDQFLLEEINEISEGSFDRSPYVGWATTFRFEDTTERSGLQSSGGGINIRLAEDLEDVSDEPVPMPYLTKSARAFQRLVGNQEAVAQPVQTPNEVKLFADIHNDFFNPRLKNKHDFENLTRHWNDNITNYRQSHGSEIRKKTAQHLESYYKSILERENSRLALSHKSSEGKQLKRDLRELPQ
ncbi:hypothetical protein HDU97_009843, partial [Phlyctochytrium planicorne]